MPQPRQLAVIMFTDIVGYTLLMQQDESHALNLLDRFKKLLKSTSSEFQGEIIQYYGDGCLMIFSNSLDAVNCAKSLQENFQKEPLVPARIGIHLGDIVVSEGNIFGDCVNITSRIESMGSPGAVLFSESVKKQIQNKLLFQVVSLGKFEFKNVVDPMEIFALANNGLPALNREEANGKFKEQKNMKSIAVLPFVNMSNDSEQEYFSDGIAEEIINSLAHLNDLKVAGRTSSFQFKGKNVDLRKVGEKLKVCTVLEGSVRKQGNRLRITAQLIDVENGYHLWSERYDREIDDVFAIQDDIALAVTEKLKLTLLKKDRDLITKTYTQNTEAYELYLKGRFYIGRRGTSIFASMEYFQKAIDLDPDFALAYSAYADANSLAATYGLIHPKDALIRAKQSAEKALQLDPSLSEPYCSLGYYYACCEWNWPEAKKNFLKSLELNPRYAEAHFRYGWNYLTCVEGKFDEAKKHAETAIKLEPLSSICYANYSLILSSAGQLNEAIEACKTGIELDSNSFICHLNVASIYMVLHQYEQAIASFESAIRLSNRHHFAVNGLIQNYCITGNFSEARILMDEIIEKTKKGYVTKTFTASSAAYVDGLDKAFDYLEEAYQDHDPVLLTLKYQPWVPAALKADLRFQKFLDKIGFPN